MAARRPASTPATRDACGWCRGSIDVTARRDAIYCGVRCRQAAHRVAIRHELLEATAHPLRLAYADPPYVGKAARYYSDQPTYAGEVDHAELLERLATFDGWALSCSSASVPTLAGLAVARSSEVRLAIWHRRRPPHPTAEVVSAYEGVLYQPARSVTPGSSRRITNVLIGVDGPRRPTLPGSVVGMKPPAFATWVFDLLGALPGDELEDLYPGSGLVGRAWRDWSRVAARDASPPAAADASPPTSSDDSCDWLGCPTHHPSRPGARDG